MSWNIPTSLARRLSEIAPYGVKFDVPLAQLSFWRIGGPAAAVVDVDSIETASAVRRLLTDANARSLVIGSTSNLLFDSAGYEGVLIRLGPRFANVAVVGNDVVASSGTSVVDVARAAADEGLAGLEHTVGIPGTIGGLVVMNGGSQRKYIGSNVRSLLGVSATGEVREVAGADLALGYRTSGLGELDLAVVEVRLHLEATDEPAQVHRRMDRIVADRAAKFPLDFPSCGSTFLSDPAMYASVGPPGKAIEEAGLKGISRGAAQISPRHANFIINRGGASSDDVLGLIKLAQDVVRDRTGYTMTCEARFVYAHGEVVAADIAAQRR